MAFDLKSTIRHHLENAWYGKTGLTLLLRPLSWLFVGLSSLRRFAYRSGFKKSTRLPVPVVIVGNLTVGGTGKTPLVIWLANYLKRNGYKPGIISRGYGGQAHNWPQQVRPDADPVVVGDEAVLISRRTNCPMAVGPDRVAAGQALLKYSDCDVLLSDDGLQHYALKRDVEILVIDGIRRFGNGFCLPAGPLRECVSRQHEVDYKITSGIAAQGEYPMKYVDAFAVNLKNGERQPLKSFSGQKIFAIAGIGNPDRFFNYLRSQGLRIDCRAFPDHFAYTATSIPSADNTIVLMTEKDAVKCRRFAGDNWWYVHSEVELPDEFAMQLLNLLGKFHG